MALALLLILIPLAGCDSGTDGPDPLAPGRDDQSGRSSGGAGAAAIVGSWRNISIVEVPGDLQTWTTTWRFDEDGVCRQSVEVESLAEGFPRVTERSCSYTTAGNEITIDFVGGGTVTFEFSFAGFSPDRLVLDGFEYERLP